MSVLPTPSIQLARSLQSVPADDVKAMNAFELFQKQLESGSAEAAVDAMKRLPVVAIAMGQADSKSLLVPYLTKLALQQPPHVDELLLLLGQQLVPVTQFMTDSVSDFLPLLERLAAVEETVVRDQAVEVLVQLAERSLEQKKKKQNPALVAEMDSQWMGLVKRLAAADWFTAKVSAAGLVASVLALVIHDDDKGGAAGAADAAAAAASGSNHQFELLQIYKDLCQDETPMVRRAAAKHLGHVLKEAGWNHRDFASTVLPALCRDEQDSVRLLAVAALASAGPAFGQANPQWTIQFWLPLVKDGSTDMSWRVRNNLAKHFSDVAYSLGISGGDQRRSFQNEQSLVMACFVALLTDIESEVRAASVSHLARMVAWGGPAHFGAHLQPLLPTLADDVIMEVRSKCALALMDAAHGGSLQDSVILSSFGPLLESFLQDEFHEVQLQVLGNLHKISHLLPGLSGVVSALMTMSKASNWRVRQAIAQLLPHLAEARGLDFFQTVLFEPAWQVLLMDPVASVRMAVVQGMGLLVRVAGPEWISSTLMPRTVSIYNQFSNSYLIRITILQTHIEIACQETTGPVFVEAVTQVLRALNQDKVANVRMVAAKGLFRIVEKGQADIVQGQIRPALETRLQEDVDDDCRLACSVALEQIK